MTEPITVQPSGVTLSLTTIPIGLLVCTAFAGTDVTSIDMH